MRDRKRGNERERERWEEGRKRQRGTERWGGRKGVRKRAEDGGRGRGSEGRTPGERQTEGARTTVREKGGEGESALGSRGKELERDGGRRGSLGAVEGGVGKLNLQSCLGFRD